jgi:hypothetical protein
MRRFSHPKIIGKIIHYFFTDIKMNEISKEIRLRFGVSTDEPNLVSESWKYVLRHPKVDEAMLKIGVIYSSQQ